MWVKPKSHTRANQRKRAKFAHRTSEAGSSARHVQPSLRSAARRSLDGVRGRRPSTTPGRHVLLLPVLEAQVQGRAARRSARAASTRARQCWSPGTAIGILQRRQCRRAGCGWREAVHGRRFFVRETWNRVSRLGGDESDDEPHSGAAAHEWHGDRRAAARRAWATAARTKRARGAPASSRSRACTTRWRCWRSTASVATGCSPAPRDVASELSRDRPAAGRLSDPRLRSSPFIHPPHTSALDEGGLGVSAGSWRRFGGGTRERGTATRPRTAASPPPRPPSRRVASRRLLADL